MARPGQISSRNGSPSLARTLPILPQATCNLPESLPWSGHTLHLGVRRHGLERTAQAFVPAFLPDWVS